MQGSKHAIYANTKSLKISKTASMHIAYTFITFIFKCFLIDQEDSQCRENSCKGNKPESCQTAKINFSSAFGSLMAVFALSSAGPHSFYHYFEVSRSA